MGVVCHSSSCEKKVLGNSWSAQLIETSTLQALTSVNPTIYNSIKELAEDPNTDVVIFSGSDREKLEDTFGDLNVWLAAENGMYLRSPCTRPEDEASPTSKGKE